MGSLFTSADDHRPEELVPGALGEGTGRLFAAFSALSLGQQVLIWHLDVLGQPMGEVAALLDTSEESVIALLEEARTALREHHHRH